MRALVLLSLIGCSEAATREEPEDEPAKAAEDTGELRGTWEVVSSEFEGEDASAIYRPGTTWATVIVFEGDQCYFTDGFTKSDPAGFKFDPIARPRTIDMGAMKGIYSLDGDTLKLCINSAGERPKEFKTTAGDQTNLLVLKRREP